MCGRADLCEMLAIMGTSGAGKTTRTDIHSGQINPARSSFISFLLPSFFLLI